VGTAQSDPWEAGYRPRTSRGAPGFARCSDLAQDFTATTTLNTAMKFGMALPANSEAYTTTTVLVQDDRQAHLTGP
jgi:hypothetical protein